MLILLLACSGGNDAGEIIDGVLLPDVTDVVFTDTVDHPFFPLPPGATWTYTAEKPGGVESSYVQVDSEVSELAGGQALMLHTIDGLDGQPVGETWDWVAQDTEGNLWNVGSSSCVYDDDDDCIDSTAWAWGEAGALPGWLLPADPTVDEQPYFEEYAAGVAQGVAEVIGTEETVTVPSGTFDDCVRTQNTSRVTPTLMEERAYCRDIGLVLVDGGDVPTQLVAKTGI